MNKVRREIWAVRDRKTGVTGLTAKVAVRRPNGTFLPATNYRQEGIR